MRVRAGLGLGLGSITLMVKVTTRFGEQTDLSARVNDEGLRLGLGLGLRLKLGLVKG